MLVCECDFVFRGTARISNVGRHLRGPLCPDFAHGELCGREFECRVRRAGERNQLADGGGAEAIDKREAEQGESGRRDIHTVDVRYSKAAEFASCCGAGGSASFQCGTTALSGGSKWPAAIRCASSPPEWPEKSTGQVQIRPAFRRSEAPR